MQAKGHWMRGNIGWLVMVLAMVVSTSWVDAAQIFVWTDPQGVVHMTDQWANVPEAMRGRVSVRESTEPSVSTPQATPRAEAETTPTAPPVVLQPPRQGSLDLSEPAIPSITPPAVPPYPPYASGFIPRPHAFIRPKIFPPFPQNVRLDPFDANFVWVGPNRVPKSLFTYPHISLEQQTRFQERIRALEHRGTASGRRVPGVKHSKRP